MKTPLRTNHTFNRSAIMRDAHRQWRQSQSLGLGWDWSKCMRRAWEAAKGRAILQQQRARITRDIIRLAA